jgi:hypothetical protein
MGMNSEPHMQDATTADQDLAYRRLAAVILQLDVPTLAQQLQAARSQAEYSLGDFAHAA